MSEQLLLRFFPLNMTRRCLETSYHKIASGSGLIRKVRKLGGSTFVFLTGFGPLLPAMDHEENMEEEKIYRILGRGVDGIMTDRPKRVREVIDKWKISQFV
jgi:glycerophosphoryl diester phosphodiesterase